MVLYNDYLLVKEIIEDGTIEGTMLKIKHDDTERFMKVEVVETSKDLKIYLKEKFSFDDVYASERALEFEPTNKFIINRVAKTPYKDGLYFISVNDVIAKVE